MKVPIAIASTLLVALSLPLLQARPKSAQDRAVPPAVKTIHPTFTSIDAPGAGVTQVDGINSEGNIVGVYGANSADPHQRGFLLKNGRFIHVDYPQAYATLPSGINDAGLIVGSARFQHGNLWEGFTYDGTTFTRFHDGTGGSTIAYSINNSDKIVGGAGTLYATQGFLEINRIFKTIKFPENSIYAWATGINDLGEIVGFTDPDYNSYSDVNGHFQSLDVPGATETLVQGINDNSVAVGWYGVPDGCLCAFAEHNGRYVSFSYPGAQGTVAYGISASGQAVGQYTLDYKIFHGFMTSPILFQ